VTNLPRLLLVRWTAGRDKARRGETIHPKTRRNYELLFIRGVVVQRVFITRAQTVVVGITSYDNSHHRAESSIVPTVDRWPRASWSGAIYSSRRLDARRPFNTDDNWQLTFCLWYFYRQISQFSSLLPNVNAGHYIENAFYAYGTK